LNERDDAGGFGKLFAGASLVTTGRVLAGLFNLLILVGLTRLLSKEVFAVFVLVFLVGQTISAIGPLGLPSALVYFVARKDPGQSHPLGWHTVLALLALGMVAAVVLFFAAPLLERGLSMPGATIPLQLLGLYLVFEFPSLALPNYLLALHRFRSSFLTTLFFSGGQLLTLVVPAALGASLQVIMFWFVVGAATRFIATLAFLTIGRSGQTRRKGWKLFDLLAYGLPLTASSMVSRINVQIDKYIVAILATQETFAAFALGAMELPLVTTVAYTVTEALIPTLVKLYSGRRTRDFRTLWHGAMTKVAALIMPVFAYFFVLADSAVSVLFSSDYELAAIPFRIYLVLLPLRLCSYGGIVRALGETRYVVYASLAALFVNVVLNWPFYLLFSIAGPALASLTAQLVAIGILLFYIRGRLDLTWTSLLPLGAIGKTMLVATLSALPLIPVLRYVPGDGLRMAAGLVVYLPVYLFLAVRIGLLTLDDLRLLVGKGKAVDPGQSTKIQ